MNGKNLPLKDSPSGMKNINAELRKRIRVWMDKNNDKFPPEATTRQVVDVMVMDLAADASKRYGHA